MVNVVTREVMHIYWNLNILALNQLKGIIFDINNIDVLREYRERFEIWQTSITAGRISK